MRREEADLRKRADGAEVHDTNGLEEERVEE